MVGGLRVIVRIDLLVFLGETASHQDFSAERMEVYGIAHIGHSDLGTIRRSFGSEQNLLLTSHPERIGNIHHFPDHVGPRPRDIDHRPRGELFLVSEDRLHRTAPDANGTDRAHLADFHAQLSRPSEIGNCRLVGVCVTGVGLVGDTRNV